jgi:CheY-like chemotaxis protein
MVRVLIVEDDKDSRDVAIYMFKYHQIAVDGAATGEEALELMHATYYGLFVIDLALPGMDGWHLLNRIKAMDNLASIPCIAVTSYHDVKVAREALQAGFFAYYRKPLETSFVTELKKTLLGQ